MDGSDTGDVIIIGSLAEASVFEFLLSFGILKQKFCIQIDLGYYVSKIYSLNSVTLVMNISNYIILRKRTSCFVKDLM